jgi:hypothetical protein
LARMRWSTGSPASRAGRKKSEKGLYFNYKNHLLVKPGDIAATATHASHANSGICRTVRLNQKYMINSGLEYESPNGAEPARWI